MTGDPLPRTVEDIVARVKEIRVGGPIQDQHHVRQKVLLSYLPLGNALRTQALHADFAARITVEPEAVKSEWAERQRPLRGLAVAEDMAGYLPHAVGWAVEHKTATCLRTTDYYREWLWLLGDDEILPELEADRGQTGFGAPLLNAIAEKYGLARPELMRSDVFVALVTGAMCPLCDIGHGVFGD